MPGGCPVTWASEAWAPFAVGRRRGGWTHASLVRFCTEVCPSPRSQVDGAEVPLGGEWLRLSAPCLSLVGLCSF